MSLYKEQKVTKPKPEAVAGDFLNAERTASLLKFTAFLRENKIGISWATSNSWSLRYKGKLLGSLHFHDGNWRFAHRGLEKYYEMEEGDLKSFIFDNIYIRECGNCQWTLTATKVDYMQPTTCGCWPLRIFNADGEVLENTKRLIEYRMKCITVDKESL